ncbi:MrpH family fimbial adhesin [Serratia surfactantfaciens]|uniref:MrpH family fimbial adhesin n=1 Tax=Serratia surfactantfaciens TaxID=2741499 RepID=UPI0018E438AD|nr:PapG chaperone-binding domain-containing protein [Serratia surfactantfaciens]MBI6151092.1 hypothetical protein [Serratia surfactantfaciens]
MKLKKIYINRVFISGFLLLAMLFAPGGYAGWDAEVRYEPKKRQYFAKVIYWDTSDTTPNPLYRCTYLCYLAVFARDNRTSGAEMWPQIDFQEIVTSKTLGELAQNFAKRGYLNRELVSAPYFGDGDACVYLGYWRLLQGNAAYAPTMLPGGMACTPPVIDPTACDITEQQLELRHGALSSEEVNGHTVSTSLHVKCNINFPIRIMSPDRSGNVYLNAEKKFRSVLKIDGVDLGEGKTLEGTPAGAELTLSSTLMGYEGGSGVFQGSKTIIVSLQ